MATIDKSKFTFVKRDDFASEIIDAPAYSYWKSVMRQFLRKKSTIAMLGILVAIVLMSFIYPIFSNFDFNDVSKVNDFSARYIKPNAQYWFGTDSNGKSLFDGVWFGARNSILISVIATVINLVIGIVIGGIWGISKTVDRVMIEIYNIISNIPPLLIVIVLTYSIGAGFWNLIFAMTITGWIGIAYNIRLGLPVTVPSLGRLISDYSQNVTTNAYLFWIPLTTLILVSLSLFVVGQNLADASDPRTHR